MDGYAVAVGRERATLGIDFMLFFATLMLFAQKFIRGRKKMVYFSASCRRVIRLQPIHAIYVFMYFYLNLTFSLVHDCCMHKLFTSNKNLNGICL